METNQFEIRFGMAAVKKGYATPEQIIEALEIQVKEDLSSGKHTPIGEIMISQNLINESQLDEILEAIGKKEGS